MFDFAKIYQASSLSDALDALRRDPDAILIAGGTDVLLRIREGRPPDARLLSIHGLPELSGVTLEPDGTLCIGAGTVMAELTADPLISAHLPWLGEAAGRVGGPQTRRAATVGGNLCNGATSADTAPALCASDAILELHSPDGVRRLPLTEFYTGPGQTVRRPDEILTAIRIPRPAYAGFAGATAKYGKRAAMEISTLNCALTLRLTDDRRSVDCLRLAFGVAAPTPIRCPSAEARAAGQPLTPALADTLAQAALEETAPRDSWRASRAFRRQLIAELTRRCLAEAVRRAGGEWICSK